MKRRYLIGLLAGLEKNPRRLVILSLLLSAAAINLNAQTYTFTTCNATGQTGPTQLQVNTGYVSTNLAGAVTITTLGIQQWIVPTTGAYRISGTGAQGGVSWGLGASMAGDFNLTAGTMLRIVVGQQGGSLDASHGSGGGASFVVDNLNNPLIVAGGGGGRGASSTSILGVAHGSTLTPGQSPVGGGPGGTGGGGGAAANGTTGGTATTPGAGSTSSTWASGGGGFFTDGGMYSNNTLNGGRAFFNGALGGDPATGANTAGGFGGGGGAGDRAAGGGGYSGGGGGTSGTEAGGGGSFNGGLNQVNVGGINSGNGLVMITALCNISLTTPVNPICIGGTVVLSTNAASGILWSNNTNGSSISVTPTVTTTYSVTGTSTANCIAGSFITVTVNPLPVISAVVSPTTLCVGSTATIVASGASTYTWSTGPSGATTTVNPGVTTVYSIAAKSIYGCLNSNTVVVNVNSNSLTINSNTTICMGSSIILTANGAITYSWSNGITFQSTPISPTVNTTYTATALDNYNCPLTNIVSVAVSPLPAVVVTASKNSVCKGENVTLNASGATTYTWNNGFVGTQVVYNVPVDVAYYYSVTGVDATGCTKTASITITGLRCVGINEIENSGVNVNVLPNPGTGLFKLEIADSGQNLSIKVYNTLGMLIKNQNVVTGSNQLDIQNEKAGIYLIYVINHDSKAIKLLKVIKE